MFQEDIKKNLKYGKHAEVFQRKNSVIPESIHPVGERLFVIRGQEVGPFPGFLDFIRVSFGKIIVRRYDSMFRGQLNLAQSAVILGTLVVKQFVGSQHEPPPFPEVETTAVLLMQPPFHDDISAAGEIGSLTSGQPRFFAFAKAATKLAKFRFLLHGRLLRLRR